MKFLKHMSENLFISFTGIAALVHSTWALGTMFSGEMPLGDWWALAWWGVPAFFVAFAMDIGQISTSADIRHKGLTVQRGITFFVFAVATYYLQFLYIAHHMPSLEIAGGVSEFHRMTVVTARDAAIWILPLLLPLSTMLYTISDGDKKEQPIAPTLPEPTLEVTTPPRPLIEEKTKEIAESTILAQEIIQEPKYQAYCEDCGWSVEYPNQKKAERALRTHQNLHCSKGHFGEMFLDEKGYAQEKVNQNGHVE